MSLHNRIINQQLKPSLSSKLPLKSGGISSLAAPKNVLPERKVLMGNKGQFALPEKKCMPVSTKIPTLSALRENLPGPKRQKILQEVVRTAGKENGFLSYRDRPESVTDIYADDVANESVVVAYVEHIYAYLFHREVVIPNTFIEGMSVNARMRAILVDWIVSVAYKFKMCQDTLFLALNIVDRFLSIPEIDVTKDELQLLGVTAMFIAGKFEEVYPPDLDDYVFISDHACTKTQIVEAEIMVVTALNFDFTRPLATHFLRRCCKAACATPEEYATSKYFSELSQLNIDFVAVKPSLIAASAVYLALVRRGADKFWSPSMAFYSNYEESEVKPIAAKLFQLVKDAPKTRQQCIPKKYGSSKNYEVSNIPASQLSALARHFGMTPGVF